MLHIGKSNPRLGYIMDEKVLPSVEFDKDLGLNITENHQQENLILLLLLLCKG